MYNDEQTNFGKQANTMNCHVVFSEELMRRTNDDKCCQVISYGTKIVK